MREEIKEETLIKDLDIIKTMKTIITMIIVIIVMSTNREIPRVEATSILIISSLLLFF